MLNSLPSSINAETLAHQTATIRHSPPTTEQQMPSVHPSRPEDTVNLTAAEQSILAAFQQASPTSGKIVEPSEAKDLKAQHSLQSKSVAKATDVH